MAALARPWKEYADKKRAGHPKYYHNHTTGETTWFMPAEFEQQPRTTGVPSATAAGTGAGADAGTGWGTGAGTGSGAGMVTDGSLPLDLPSLSLELRDCVLSAFA